MCFPSGPPSPPGFAASCDTSAAMSEGVRPARSICSPRVRRTSLASSAVAGRGPTRGRRSAPWRSRSPTRQVDEPAVPARRDDEEAAADDLGLAVAAKGAVRLEPAVLPAGGTEQRYGDAVVLGQGLGFGAVEPDGGQGAVHVGKDRRLARQVAHGHVDRGDLGAAAVSAARDAARYVGVGGIDLEIASGGAGPRGLGERILDVEHGIGRKSQARRVLEQDTESLVVGQ